MNRAYANGPIRNTAMSDLILHHYPTSPFAEKIRAILGFKNLPWKSVHIPTIMPKPDLTALTGGYRKTPVLQIGSDIYCDTKLIARVLETAQPSPSLFVKGREASCAMQEQWSEKLFSLCVPVIFAPQGLAHVFSKLPPSAIGDFQKDRASLFTGGSGQRPSAAASKGELPGILALLEAQLGVMPFMDGAAPTLSDFSVYHPIWFINSNPGVAAYFQPYPNIRAWAQRIASFGHGKPEILGSDEAVRTAYNSKPRESYSVNDPSGLKAGDTISVSATDYGTDAVTGALVHADLYSVALRRTDERAGETTVHFPRAGFKISAAGATP